MKPCLSCNLMSLQSKMMCTAHTVSQQQECCPQFKSMWLSKHLCWKRTFSLKGKVINFIESYSSLLTSSFSLGLHILYSLLKSLEQETAVQSFYQTYYMMIVQHVLSVVTDTSHTAGNEKLS